MTYTSQVSPTVQAAADSFVHESRGWTTEEDKRDKILNMTKFRWMADAYSQEVLHIKYESGICRYLLADFSDNCK